MKEPKIYLEHILEAIDKIEEYLGDQDFSQFNQDTKTQDAVIRQFEVIGEAVNQLQADFLSQYPDLPWEKIVAMRNKLIHEYFGVDIEVVWQTIQKRLPELKVVIKKALKK